VQPLDDGAEVEEEGADVLRDDWTELGNEVKEFVGKALNLLDRKSNMQSLAGHSVCNLLWQRKHGQGGKIWTKGARRGNRGNRG
jgi:hypothetical protein